MDVNDALFALVHDYPGGSESLAPRMGLSPRVLRNKVQADCETHVPTVRDLRRAMALSKDLRPLHALCDEFEGVFVHTPPGEDPDDMAVLELMAAMWKSNGELGEAVHHALVDKVLTSEEFKRIEAAKYAYLQRIETMMNRLGTMVQPVGARDV